MKIFGIVALAALSLIAPMVVYPVFLMKILCFALFASAFNLLLGFVGLLSFGHAAFFGSAAYVTAHAVKVWGWPPELGILAAMAVSAGLGFVIGPAIGAVGHPKCDLMRNADLRVLRSHFLTGTPPL